MQISKILLLAFLAMLALCVNLFSYDTTSYAELGVEKVQKIPLRIGTWTGRDNSLDAKVYDILETEAILHRNYTNSAGENVFLSLVYYPDAKVDFHSPAACLAPRSVPLNKIADQLTLPMHDGPDRYIAVNRLLYEDRGYDVLVYYFFKTGNYWGRSYITLRLQLILHKFFNPTKSGAMIRVSTHIDSKDSLDSSKKIIEKFTANLYPYLVQHL